MSSVISISDPLSPPRTHRTPHIRVQLPVREPAAAADLPVASAAEDLRRIAMPLHVRWRRSRYRVVPGIVFVLAAISMVYVWTSLAERVTVAGEVEGADVVTYLGRDHRLRAQPGMEVQVRLASEPRRSHAGQVVTVGAKMQSVPDHLLLNPKVAQWGRPVRITLPADAGLQSGDRVAVIFSWPRK